MNSVQIKSLNRTLFLSVTLASLLVPTTDAAEWWHSLEDKNGFSEFAPPPRFKQEHNQHEDKIEWRSGSSFKNFNKERYEISRVSRNPWKPVKSYGNRQSISGQRPWGNVSVKKPAKSNNMRFHDQRFKSWISRADEAYRSRSMSMGSGNDYASYLYPVRGNYGNTAPILNDSFISPVLYTGSHLPGGYVPFGSNVPMGYGIYNGMYFPYTGFINRPGIW